MRKYLFIFILLLFAGCNKWLSITPSDTMSEDQTFSSVEGFRNALNSIYIELNHENLYGKDLTVGYIELIGCRYFVHKENVAALQLYEHNYNSTSVTQGADKIWKKAYNLLANVNILIDNCEKNRSVIEGKNYNIIKGEALALRAFLHFDLFRIFGPVYSPKSPAVIPYNHKFEFTTPVIMTCEQFMSYVIADLSEAKELLAIDPIVGKAPSFSGDIYDHFRNRTLRMNYFATTLLRARAALYMEDKVLALSDAKEVIAVQETHYPFSTKEQVEDPINPDRIFSSELIFALETTKRGEIFTSMFDPETIADKAILAPTSYEIEDILFKSDFNTDLRSKSITKTRKIGYTTYHFSFKYKNITDETEMLNRLMPMLRVSEAFYIAAECDPDEAAGYKYLDKIRNARGISGSINKNKESYIEGEYLREFIGEGQAFYYYKRKNLAKISDGDGYKGINMKKEAYQVPVPKSENP